MVNGLGDNEIIIKICKTVQTIILRNKSGSFSLPSPFIINYMFDAFFSSVLDISKKKVMIFFF